MSELSTENHAEAHAGTPEPRWFVALYFDLAPVFVHSGLGDIQTLGELWLGVGSLGGISGLAASTELSAKPVTLQLSAIPREYVALALAEHYQGRRADILLGFMRDGALVAEPSLIGRYKMDTCDIEMGETGTIIVSLQDPLAAWARPKIRRSTDADQQLDYPGDRGYEHVAQMVNKEIVWGNF